MKEAIIRHFQRYSGIQSSDVFKLIYQATFGPRHANFEPTIKRIREYIQDEMNELPANRNDLLMIAIGGGFVRIDLEAVRLGILSIEELAELFHQSMLCSPTMDDSSRQVFVERIADFVTLAQEGLCPIPATLVEKEVEDYLAGGIRPVHHSATYRALYHPHYRVVAISLMDAELFKKLSEETHE